MRVGLDPLGASAEPQLDHLVLVFLGRPDVGLLPFDLPAEKALGQRRPMVRRVGLGGDDRHGRLASGRAVLGDEPARGEPATDDDDGVGFGCHERTSTRSGRFLTPAGPARGSGRRQRRLGHRREALAAHVAPVAAPAQHVPQADDADDADDLAVADALDERERPSGGRLAALRWRRKLNSSSASAADRAGRRAGSP